MTTISQIFVIVTLVTQVLGGQVLGKATGFFYLKDNNVYLVTNKHVVLDESKGIKPDTLRLKLHTDSKNLENNVDFDIPLYADGKPKWHLHPEYAEKKIDIAVVELDQKALKKGYFFKALSAENFLPEKYMIQPGEDIIVIGFPMGLSDVKHNLPLIRNATASSPYGVNFQGMPFFLIDANLQLGMSGSPVITKPKSVWVDKDGNTKIVAGSPMYFLGVHSSTINFEQTSKVEPLGLATVWYGYLIEEIIDSIKKR